MPESFWVGRGPARVLVLVLGLLLVAALAAGAVAVRAGAQGTPPGELSEQELLYRVTAAPEEAPDFSATVSVEQSLVPDALFGASKGDGTPDSGPRTARIWRGGPEKLRAELQGKNGDKVFVKNGGEVRAYDGATNTLTVGEKEEQPSDALDKAASPEEIDQFLKDISPTSDLSTGQPVRVAGRWAYPLTLEPKDKSQTLVDKAEAFVDSETFVPLLFELYAQDTAEPVARYEARDFQVGPVPDERFKLDTPPDAKVEQAKGREGDDQEGDDHGKDQEPQKVGSVAEAQKNADFPVGQLTGSLGDRGLTEVRLKGSEGVLQTYGEGFGTVVLAQQAEGADESSSDQGSGNQGSGDGDSGDNGRGGLQVPTVDLGGGVEAREISTPIGTVLSWSANGVSYRLAGSVPASELEEAARGLLSR